VAAETITLIREMATDNRPWGTERIRGALLKLGIRVAKTTIQRHVRSTRLPRRAWQPWSSFPRNHTNGIRACDLPTVTDLLFRPLYAFFLVALESRRVVHVGVTRQRSDAWAAQQLREATPFGSSPRTRSAIATAIAGRPRIGETARPGRYRTRYDRLGHR
jgi:putative transposase